MAGFIGCASIVVLLIVSSCSAAATVSAVLEAVTATTASSTSANDDVQLVTGTAGDSAALLAAESERLHQLSRQVAESNRALQGLLASKLRDVNYATVIGELRSEIDSLR